MTPSNFHTHTCFCDGNDTPEELVLEAIRLGSREIGFSGHSYAHIYSYCMSIEGTKQYREEITRLKEKYKDKIKIHLGIEQDYFSDLGTEGYDYVIGSVHTVLKDGIYIPVDESREVFTYMVKKFYGGDYYSFIEDYYELEGNVIEKTDCDIIGHFDLVTKFNEGNCLFDTGNERYIRASTNALLRLIEKKPVFEVNTGAISRGYRTAPYPQKELLDIILKSGCQVIYTSDCHKKEHLLFGLPEE